jgi:hypothetical protein
MSTNTELDIRSMVNGYYDWLRQETTCRTVNGVGEITTPFTDRHNDFLQIYVIPDGDGFILTDLGSTISDLEICGCNIKTKTRQTLLQETLRGIGVQLSGNEITIRAVKNDFPLKKHLLLQAMLAVNDLFYTTRNTVQSLFFEEVSKWIYANKIHASQRVSFPGKSGVSSSFDFLITPTENAPERLVKTLTNPKTETAKNVAFSWVEVKDCRPANTKMFAFVNDSVPVDPAIDSIFDCYDITAIPWSNRDAFVAELRA